MRLRDIFGPAASDLALASLDTTDFDYRGFSFPNPTGTGRECGCLVGACLIATATLAEKPQFPGVRWSIGYPMHATACFEAERLLSRPLTGVEQGCIAEAIFDWDTEFADSRPMRAQHHLTG